MSATTEEQDAKAAGEKAKRIDLLVSFVIAAVLTTAFKVWLAPEAATWVVLLVGTICWAVTFGSCTKRRAFENQAYGPAKK